MAKRTLKTKPARQFSSIVVAPWKVIYPTRTEDGSMEYEARDNGDLIGFFRTSEAATAALLARPAHESYEVAA